jgi:hypothetical protein
MVISIVKGLRLGEKINDFIQVGYIIALVLLVSLILEFGIYGQLVYSLFKDIEEISEKNFHEKK